MRPETSLLGVTLVRGGGGASLCAWDRGLGHSFGGLFTTLNTQAKFYLIRVRRRGKSFLSPRPLQVKTIVSEGSYLCHDGRRCKKSAGTG